MTKTFWTSFLADKFELKLPGGYTLPSFPTLVNTYCMGNQWRGKKRRGNKNILLTIEGNTSDLLAVNGWTWIKKDFWKFITSLLTPFIASNQICKYVQVKITWLSAKIYICFKCSRYTIWTSYFCKRREQLKSHRHSY